MSKLTEASETAKQKASELSRAAKQRAEDVYERGRDAAARGAKSSKEMAAKARQKSGDAVETSPLAIVAGGLALGAIVAALLPRTEKETQILGKAGRKINSTAKAAAVAAKEAGQARMKEVGLDGTAAKEQFRELFGKATEAAKAAGQAAKDAARNRDQK